jgi:predicted nucleotidyltransferase
MQAHRAIEEMVARIVEAASPDRIILFGSYARNGADPESDVDLLILFRELGNRAGMTSRLYSRLVGSALPKDMVIATTEEFERYRQVPNCIFWVAARQGRLIYEA